MNCDGAGRAASSPSCPGGEDAEPRDCADEDEVWCSKLLATLVALVPTPDGRAMPGIAAASLRGTSLTSRRAGGCGIAFENEEEMERAGAGGLPSLAEDDDDAAGIADSDMSVWLFDCCGSVVHERLGNPTNQWAVSWLWQQRLLRADKLEVEKASGVCIRAQAQPREHASLCGERKERVML